MYNYQHLLTPKNIGSGIAQQLLIAPVEYFATNGIKSPPATGTNPGDEVIISSSHVFKSGKGFIEILLAPELNSFQATQMGDKGSSKFDQSLRVFVPGSYFEVHETVKNLLNVPFIALIKDSECPADFYYQVGACGVYAYFTCDFTTGTTKEGKKGYEMVLNYTHSFVQLYQGNVRKLGGPVSTVLLGVDDLAAELNYLIGEDENNLLGFEE
ncbi:MAG TPA: hypothetical protein VEB42_02295 [Chitinophagaceae bacterium]|nr:hypothetical protein [Chitinophagaceae bacterium]